MPKAIPKSSSSSPEVAPARKRKLEPDEGPSEARRARVRPRVPSAVVNGVRAVQQRSNVDGRVSMPLTTRRMSSPPAVSSTTSPEPSPNVTGTSDFLLEALRRIRELQDELDFLQNDPYAEDTDDEDDESHDDGEDPANRADDTVGGQRAEAIGWAVCARETMHFLQREGISPDSPLMMNLRRRLIGRHGDAGSGALDEGLSC